MGRMSKLRKEIKAAGAFYRVANKKARDKMEEAD
jgi:hypothetical protein